MTNLQKRISSGLVLLIALAIVIKASLINITLLVLLTLVCLEFLSFFKNRIISQLFISAIIATFILNYYFSLLEIPYFFIGCIIWIGLFIRILLYDNPNMSSKEILCAGYLMIMPSYISGGFISHTYPKLLLLILLAVSFADSAAYFFGKKYGKRILLKNTSPGKTLEGLIGAIILTPVFLVLISDYLEIKLFGAILLGVAVTPISFMGDVAFSFIKRSSNMKDSSSLIPGHGGFIDLLDGSIASLPFFAVLLMVAESFIRNAFYQ
ncbi:phosphatidate cytidylyltransferase [Gammaproteobacteria bacterium]|nr:phosphatidate cytidylyltransferase [Gammaproteobacteria bacterium]